MIKKLRNLKRRHIIIIVTGLALVAIIASGFYFLKKGERTKESGKDIYIGWGLEVFDKIQTTYWKKATENDLSELFGLALQKVSGKPINLTSKTRAEIKDVFISELAGKSDEDKKKFVTNVAAVVLYNLPPIGRNGLYTFQDETALRNEVKNVDTGKDLYKELGLEKGATPEDVEKSYQTAEKKLKEEGTPEAKRKLRNSPMPKKFSPLRSPRPITIRQKLSRRSLVKRYHRRCTIFI